MPSRFLCVARATGSASKPLKINIPSTIPRCPDLSFDRDVMLPPLAQCTHFVNLTNGLEAVPHLHALRVNYQIVRSADGNGSRSHVRASALQCSSSQFCHPVSASRTCLVWDYGCRSNHGCSRAIWYGLEFLRKLRYYKKFVPDDVKQLALYGVYRSTQHDGEEDFYRDIAEAYLRPISPQNSLQWTQNSSPLHAEHDARTVAIPRISETPSQRASFTNNAALHSWNSLLEDSLDSCSPLSSKATQASPTVQQPLLTELWRPNGSFPSRISSPSEWETVRNCLDAAQSLSMLGFHVFHGGLSPAGYENYQSALASARKQQQISV